MINSFPLPSVFTLNYADHNPTPVLPPIVYCWHPFFLAQSQFSGFHDKYHAALRCTSVL